MDQLNQVGSLELSSENMAFTITYGLKSSCYNQLLDFILLSANLKLQWGLKV